MRKTLIFAGAFLVSVTLCVHTQAQNNQLDSLYDEYNTDAELFTEISTLDPNKAALLSAILPGLGQVYNKQYWKLPIIIGAGFTLGYYINYNHEYYQSLRNALIAIDDNDPTTVNPFSELQRNTLESRTERFRRDRDYLFIMSALAYLLNIVDAHVSAHLEEFAINDELKLSFEPSLQTIPSGTASVGFGIALKF